MALDYDSIIKCLDEVQSELLNIGDTRCNKLRDGTQLSAVIFLLLRANSLFRSMLQQLAVKQLDAYDAVRRAYLETWLLALEFRLEGSGPQAAKWLARVGGSWSPNIAKVEAFARSQGIKVPTLGRDYGNLSDLAHPTRNAAENSVAIITARFGDETALRSVSDAAARFEKEDVPELLYRFVWLVAHGSKGLIPIDAKNMPNADRYAKQYSDSLANAQPKSHD